jgi:hypothetical protein
MKLGVYIIAPEPISSAYSINPSHQSLRLYVYPLSLLDNDSVKMSPRQRIHTQLIEELLNESYLCGTCRIYDSRKLAFPRTSFYILGLYIRRRIKKLALRSFVIVDHRRDEIGCILKTSGISSTMSNSLECVVIDFTSYSSTITVTPFIYVHSLKHQTTLHYSCT